MNDSKTMRALRFVGYQMPFEFREVPIPEAGPGEVVIKVAMVVALDSTEDRLAIAKALGADRCCPIPRPQRRFRK